MSTPFLRRFHPTLSAGRSRPLRPLAALVTAALLASLAGALAPAGQVAAAPTDADVLVLGSIRLAALACDC